MLCFFIIYKQRRRAYDEKMALTIDPDDDIRENIVSYHDEGAGEEDMHAYDITPLRIPIGPKDSPSTIGRKPMIPSEAKPSMQRPPRTITLIVLMMVIVGLMFEFIRNSQTKISLTRIPCYYYPIKCFSKIV